MNIVIIGGSRGIGKAAARELLQDGHKVLIVGRNPKTLEETGKELAGAATYSCDAGKAEETAGLVEAVKGGSITEFGSRVDGLILCAAAFPNPSTQRSVGSKSDLSSSEDFFLVSVQVPPGLMRDTPIPIGLLSSRRA